MADVDAFGTIVTQGGGIIPLYNAAQTEGAEEELLTDSTLVGSAQTCGTFASQSMRSQRMVMAGFTSEKHVGYCFIRSAGLIKCAFPFSGKNSGHNLPARLPYPKTLVSGDQAIMKAEASSTRQVALSVACSNGEYHVFESAVIGAAKDNHVMLSILTGLSIGETLQGRTVTHAFATLGDNSSQMISPIYFVNGSGVPIGSVIADNPATDTCTYQSCVVPIALNTRLLFRTDA